MGFCIAEVVGPPNCLGTAKYIISVLLSKASVDCGGHELYGVKKRRAPQIGPTELQRGVFSFFVSVTLLTGVLLTTRVAHSPRRA